VIGVAVAAWNASTRPGSASAWPTGLTSMITLVCDLRAHISRFGAYATDELARRPPAFNRC
jgi:hypothetical protein